MCRQLSMNRCTMMRLIGHVKPHESSQRVSGIPGAVQNNLLSFMMKERIKCMFDTVIFNRIVENDISVESLNEFVEVFATYVQRKEINDEGMKDKEKQAKLNQIFNSLVSEEHYLSTESTLWDYTPWNKGKWTDPNDNYRPIRDDLDNVKKKENNFKDALIAETAKKNDLILVTEDSPLENTAPNHDVKCMSYDQLLLHCKILTP